jgi:ribosomal protein S8
LIRAGNNYLRKIKVKKKIMVNDIISDVLTRIRNGCLSKSQIVLVPLTKLSEQICHILQKEGFIDSFKRDSEKRSFEITLKYKPASYSNRRVMQLNKAQPRLRAAQPPEVLAEPPEVLAEPPEVLAETPVSFLEKDKGSSEAEPPEVLAEPPEVLAEPPVSFLEKDKGSSEAEPPEVLAEPPEVLAEPPEVLAEPPEVLAEPPEVLAEPPEVLAETPVSFLEKDKSSSKAQPRKRKRRSAKAPRIKLERPSRKGKLPEVLAEPPVSSLEKDKSSSKAELTAAQPKVKPAKNYRSLAARFSDRLGKDKSSNKVDPKSKSCITNLRRISKPGLRVYTPIKQIPRVLGGLGIFIISTSQGIMTDREARFRGIGGEVLCSVW